MDEIASGETDAERTRSVLTAWLNERVAPVESLTAEVIAGGRSNPTFQLRAADGRSWVLRRPPPDAVLPTAHDVAREHRVLAALQGTPVPVPAVVGFSDDRSLIGAPFYVMEFVKGHVVRRTRDVLHGLRPDERASLAHNLVDVLAQIHGVDVDAAGLGGHGRRDSYLQRQLRRWSRQYQETLTHDLPDMQAGLELLERLQPAQVRTTLVHGDYRLDNVILGETWNVEAVLDWELSTLGDPLCDLGQLISRCAWGQVDRGEQQAGLSTLEGFSDKDGLASSYADLTGADVAGIDYYVAFAEWRSAAILQGVYYRQIRGLVAGSSGDEDELLGLMKERSARAVQLLGPLVAAQPGDDRAEALLKP